MISIRMRVALLEDNPSEAELISHWLTLAGLLCSRHERGHTLICALGKESFDALILDWNLPEISGIDVLKHVRGTLRSSVPVLFVSARDRELDIVTALKHGADDYMVKPLHRMELLARLEAIARRGRAEPRHSEVIDIGALRVNCQTRIAHRDGVPIELTAKDFDLVALFLRNVGRLFSRAEICEAVWGCSVAFNSRTLDTHICRIRDRLGLTPAHGWRLAAVYGYGYRLQQVAMSTGRVGGDVGMTEPPRMPSAVEPERRESSG
jgi:two-component system response regulator RegX3